MGGPARSLRSDQGGAPAQSTSLYQHYPGYLGYLRTDGTFTSFSEQGNGLENRGTSRLSPGFCPSQVSLQVSVQGSFLQKTQDGATGLGVWGSTGLPRLSCFQHGLMLLFVPFRCVLPAFRMWSSIWTGLTEASVESLICVVE